MRFRVGPLGPYKPFWSPALAPGPPIIMYERDQLHGRLLHSRLLHDPDVSMSLGNKECGVQGRQQGI